jgi:hypothetical protein
MKIRWIKQALLSILLLALPFWGFVPARAARLGGVQPASRVEPNSAVNLATGFVGTLDLRGWLPSLDAPIKPLIRPEEGKPFQAALSGYAWSPLSSGTSSLVEAIVVSASGDVYVGGAFGSAGSCTGCRTIAKWDGSTWSPLGTGTNFGVSAIAVSGSDVYVVGNLTSAGNCTSGCNHIAKWNGSTWSPLGTGTNDSVWTIAVSGSDVYVGGVFTSAGTCTSGCNHIAKWNGSTWSALGTGTNDYVAAIAVSGSGVYVGGFFTSAGTCTSGCDHIAKWNGSTWSALGTGTNSAVRDIAVSGSDMYVGGDFTSAGTCTSGCGMIAKWDGSTWSALGKGTDDSVIAIAVSGSDVYVVGSFIFLGTCTNGCNHIAKWDGSTWSALGMGTNDIVHAIAVSGSNVYVGGFFSSLDTCTSGCNNIARYGPSGNANLSSLALSRGTLVPAFASGITAYTVSVTPSVSSLTVTPTAADLGATIQVRVNGGAWSAVPSGNPSGALALNLGANPLDVQVTAADGMTIITYTVTVTRALVTSTTTITNDTPDPSIINQSYPVSVTVSGSYGIPTGTVNISDGTGASCTATLSSGAGSCALTSTTTGNKTLTAAYSGDGTYNPSSNTAAHTVNKASSTTTIPSDSPDPSIINQSYTVSVSLSGSYGTPTGTVNISDGTGAGCMAILSGGAGSCALTSTTIGTKILTATYSGDDTYNSSSNTAAHSVLPFQVYLALALMNYVNYFQGPWELEPNNTYLQANGPLVSGRDYYAYPDDQKDYFSIYLQPGGNIAIDLGNYTGQGGQLQLFYQSTANLVDSDVKAPFQINYAGPAGWYYIYIYTAGNFNSSTAYTLRATYP